MPYHVHLKRRAFPHAIKRLDRHGGQIKMSDLPRRIIDETFSETKSSNYVKFFDYPLEELFVDHSTDPMHNTARQFIIPLPPSDIQTTDGRFANHQMIIRKNGETTILHAKQDLVLTNGFFVPIPKPTPPIFPPYRSSCLPTSSNSILNKISLPSKSKHPPTIKAKHNNKRQKKSFKPPQQFTNNPPPDSTLVQALHDIVDEKNHYYQQPLPPLMSVPVEFNHVDSSFHDYCNFSQMEKSNVESFDPWPFSNEKSSSIHSMPMNNYNEFSYDLLRGDYYDFSRNRDDLRQNSYFNPQTQQNNNNNSFVNSLSGFFSR